MNVNLWERRQRGAEEEKEHGVNQVRELEASVAELKNQIGELGLGELGAGLVAEGW